MDSREPLNLRLIANLLESVKEREVVNLWEKALECVARFLCSVQQGPKVWHKLFGNAAFRRDVGFEGLTPVYWGSQEAADSVKEATAKLFDFLLDDLDYREIMAAFFVKLAGMVTIYFFLIFGFNEILYCMFFVIAEAMGFEQDQMSDQVLKWGIPLVEAKFLIWGQPLSLDEDLANMFCKALRGITTMESCDTCKYSD